MKFVSALLLAATLQVILSLTSLSVQTFVTVHVTAEVVESVSAASLVIIGFDLYNEQSRTILSEDWK